METKVSGIEASYLVWDRIWKKDSQHYTEMNILDTVQLSSEGKVIGWLFTSSNGTVKSRRKENWHASTIAERCNRFENDITAHHYNANTKKWNYVRNSEQLAQAITTIGNDRTALLVHPQLSKTSTLMEVECTLQTKHGSMELPSFTNAWLSALAGRGATGSHDSLPTQSIVSKDKEANNLSRDFVLSIMKLLEASMKVRVTQIRAVVVCENIAASSRAITASNSFGGVLDSEARIVRLHHVSSVTYKQQAIATPAFSSNDSFSDMNTTVPDLSQSLADSLLPGKASRVDCCHGDFCQYVVAGDPSEGVAVGLDLEDDFNDTPFSVQSEARKAVSRHRPIKKNDPFEPRTQTDEDGQDSTADKMDLYPGQTDYLIASAQQQNSLAAAPGSSASSVSLLLAGTGDSSTAGGVSAAGGETLRSKQLPLGSLRALKSKLLGEQVKRTEKKLKVMAKSIALARQEMEEIEQHDLDQLNRASEPHSPSLKLGRTSPSKTKTAPSTAGTTNTNATKVWPASLTKWWLSVGRNMPKNSLSVMVPSSSAHCIGQTVLSAKSSSASVLEEFPMAGMSAKRLSALQASQEVNLDEVEQANSLYFGWYYNPVRVCDRCYKVYTELDRQRRVRFKHLMRKQRQQLDKEDDENQKWREVEKRIFKQRQFVSRLATLDTASTASHRAEQRGLYEGGHSFAFDSMAEGGSAVAFGRGMRHHPSSTGLLSKGPSEGASTAPVPSRALPPLPWGLSQDGRSEAYAHASTSILAKRILDREPDILPVGRHGTSYAAGRGDSAEDAATDEVLQQWREMTSVHRGAGVAEARDTRRRMRKHPKLAKLPSQPFNAERLLHPWQRQMNALKRKLKEQGTGEELTEADLLRAQESVLEAEETSPYSGDQYNASRSSSSERQVHSADYAQHHHGDAYDVPRQQTHSAGPGKATQRKAKRSLPVHTEVGPAATNSSGSSTSLQRLQNIDAAWDTSEAAAASTPHSTGTGTDSGSKAHSKSNSVGSVGSLGSPLGEKGLLSSSAVDRVSNALRDGLKLSSTAEGGGTTQQPSAAIVSVQPAAPVAVPSRPPPHRTLQYAGEEDGEEEEEGGSDDEEIGWSPFAVTN